MLDAVREMKEFIEDEEEEEDGVNVSGVYIEDRDNVVEVACEIMVDEVAMVTEVEEGEGVMVVDVDTEIGLFLTRTIFFFLFIG